MDSYDPSEAGHFGVRLFYMFRDFARRAGLRVGSRMGGPTVASTMHSRACAIGAVVQGRVSSVREVIFDGWPDFNRSRVSSVPNYSTIANSFS